MPQGPWDTVNGPAGASVGASTYMTNAEWHAEMDRVYGAGNWTDTGDWRSQAREDQLRREGAETARGTSPHTLGNVNAPGAHDIVVRGMSPEQAAAVLRARADFQYGSTFPEGRAGTQGPHLHVSMAAGAGDPWGTVNDPGAGKGSGWDTVNGPTADAPQGAAGGVGRWIDNNVPGGRLVTSAIGGIGSGVAGLTKAAGQFGDLWAQQQAQQDIALGVAPATSENQALASGQAKWSSALTDPIGAKLGDISNRFSPTNRNVFESVAHGGGEAVPAMAAAAVDPVLGAGAFGVQGYGESYDEARAKGVAPDVARTAGLENMGVQGTLGALPVGKVAEWLMPGAKGLTGYLAKRATQVGADAVLGGTMQVGSNVVAQANYDPYRGTFENVPQAAAGMAVGGVLVHGGNDLWGAARGVLRSKEPPAPDETVEDMPEAQAVDAYAAQALGGPPAGPAGHPPLSPEPESPNLPEGPTGPLPGAEAIPQAAPPPPPQYEAARIAEGAPPELMPGAIADVTELRAAPPRNFSLFQQMRELGGVRLKDANGDRYTAGPDIDAAVKGKRLPGLVNNRTGLTPDAMMGALEDRGWFGAATDDGGLAADHGANFEDMVRREAAGERVYHPEDETPQALARRAKLEDDFNAAGVGIHDTPEEAAAKLAAYRNTVAKGSGMAMEALKARAEAAGVSHADGMSHEELLGDVLEREAIQGEHLDEGSIDYDERVVDAHLTPEEHEWLSSGERGPRGERRPPAGARGSDEAALAVGGEAGSDRAPGAGAARAGVQTPIAPEGAQLARIDPRAVLDAWDKGYRPFGGRLEQIEEALFKREPLMVPAAEYDREVAGQPFAKHLTDHTTFHKTEASTKPAPEPLRLQGGRLTGEPRDREAEEKKAKPGETVRQTQERRNRERTEARDRRRPQAAPETKTEVAPEEQTLPPKETNVAAGAEGREAAAKARQKAEGESTYGKSNKVFTSEAADAAREKLRRLLGPNQLNAGIDPELVHAGITLAGYHIEAGARSFADFAKAMLDDIGEQARPYLRMWYNAARDYPGFNHQGMTPHPEVTDEAIAHVRGRGADLEQGGGQPAAQQPNGQGALPAGPGPADRGATEAGARNGGAGNRPGDLFGLPDRGAAAVREPGAEPLLGGQPGARGDVPERGEPVGGGGLGDAGIQSDPIPASHLADIADESAHLEPVAPGAHPDAASINAPDVSRETLEALPTLFPEQRGDVQFALDRFEKPEGHGVLFTNGTGTGKTFTGGGIVKMFHDAGKRDILVVAPSQGILDHWRKTMEVLGVPFEVLGSTTEAGTGPVGTTYANMGVNRHLADRPWDLVVADESHNLSSDAQGTTTNALQTLRALTNHPKGLWTKGEHQLRDDVDRVDAMKPPKKVQSGPQFERWQEERRKLDDKIKARVERFKEEDRAKAAFLSATPFAYDKNIDYADGYLFDYGPSREAGSGYNTGSARDQFFMRHFGYRMRYNKLTRPESAVDSEVMERQFHEWLKASGALSGRILSVDKDYDRKFVTVDDGVGNRIDQALDFLSTAEDGKYRALADAVNKRFDYLSRARLLEAIKAKHSVPYLTAQMKLGRKAVVFHQYNEGGGFSPFEYTPDMELQSRPDANGRLVPIKELHDEFVAKNPYVDEIDAGFRDLGSPLHQLTTAFPNALVYNGTVPKGVRARNLDLFNKDGSGHDLIIVQADAGSAGISLHDTTGKHQRVTANLGLPTRPVTAIQQEGRVYRIGQASNALFRYFNTGTNWERYAFATKVAERSGTAENLGLGDQARALRQSFIDAFLDSAPNPPARGEGTGGKALDRETAKALSEFQKAKSYYFAEQKQRGRRDQRAGLDYFPTPEPLGLKMVQWADARSGEHVLEPSAGHGAIARFFPETLTRTLVEPSSELASRAALSSPGAKVLNQPFEDLRPVNKYDAIVMNPPFGSGGATAIAHLEKAANHLREGGRIVALIPEGGPADARLEKYLESPAAKDIYKGADIRLPDSTFERAGTKARGHIVILERHADPANAPDEVRRDYSSAANITDFFDRIEHADVPDRKVANPVDRTPIAEPRTAAPAGAPARSTLFDSAQTLHGKTGEPLYVATAKDRLDSAAYKATLALAKKHGGYYSAFRGKGAIPGFQFKDAAARDDFVREATGVGAEEDKAGWETVKPGETPTTPSPAPTERVNLGGEQVEQGLLPGGEASARQAMASREAAGGLKPSVAQKGPGGLFEEPDKTSDLFGQQRAPFYSAAERAIERSPQKAASGEQWAATLRNTPGVKKEELEWTGVDDWLKLFGKERVPKEAVQAFLGSNGVHVEEHVLGGDASKDRIDRRADEIHEENVDRIADRIRESGMADQMSDAEIEDTARDQANDEYEHAVSQARAELGREPEFEDWTLPGGQDYRELLLTVPKVAEPPATHWETPGVMAHVRFDTREAPDGKKVLFIQEVQSDWHQKGRDQGYGDAASSEALKKATEAHETAREALMAADRHVVDLATKLHSDRIGRTNTAPWIAGYNEHIPDDVLRMNGKSTAVRQWLSAQERAGAETPADLHEALVQQSRVSLREDEARQARRIAEGRAGIPNAPFKTTWPALVMKRMIRWAADNGFDRVAWTTGDQQAERYNLGEAVGDIQVTRAQPDGRIAVEFRGNPELASRVAERLKTNQSRAATVEMTPAQLREVFGNSLSEHIVRHANPGGTLIPAPDIKIGGEGMKAFYDRNLVNITNDLIKRYGGKVEKTQLGSRGELEAAQRRYPDLDRMTTADLQELTSHASPDVGGFDRARAADVILAARDPLVQVPFEPHELGAQPGFDITDKMREAATDQPLFRTGGPAFGKRGLEPQARSMAGGEVRGVEADRTAKTARVIDSVERVLQRIAPGAESRPFESLTDDRGNPIQGAAFREGLRSVVAWALGARDAVGTGRHEAVHVLRKMGYLTEREWKTLTDAAKAGGWLDRYRIHQRYAGESDEQKLEEAVAERFAEHGRAPSALPAPVRAVFEKIGQALRQVAAAVRSVLGKSATADDIFGRIEAGQVGLRDPFREDYADAQTAFQRQDEEKRRPIDRLLGAGPDRIGESVKRTASKYLDTSVKDIGAAVRMGVNPMAAGPDFEQASAKEFANSERAIDHDWDRVDDWLVKSFTPEERQKMALALDREGVAKRRGEDAGTAGLKGLSARQRAAVERLDGIQERDYGWARDVGMHDSEGLEHHFPRMVVGKDGTRIKSATPKQAREGGNLTTTTGQMRQRKYETLEDTEAAAQRAFGPDAHVIRDIRAVALAARNLEKAIAGKILVNKIRDSGKEVGQDTVSDDPSKAADPGWFTIPGHPALTTWGPRFERDAATGKMQPVRTEDGHIVFESRPLYVPKTWEGPLKAVLSQPTPALWRALMTLKSKIVGTIMYNPLVHNQVIYGKAFPTMVRHTGLGALTFKMYRDGGQVRRDQAMMRRAIQSGLVPINGGYARADAGLIDRGDELHPDRGWTSELLGRAAGVVNGELAEPTKQWVDGIHDFISNKMLWNRIADLQAGIWKATSDHYVKAGYPSDVADKIASYFANLYAGAVPREATSNLARGVLNSLLFSRSFHQTNLGGVKAAIAGMPTDVRAQVRLAHGEAMATQAQGAVRAQAMSTILIDIAAANAFRILGAMAVGFLLNRAVAWPWNNERGKTDKIEIGEEPGGTKVYMNVPFGKYAGELGEWGSEPLTYAKQIMFGPTRLALQYLSNDMGYGRKAYDPYDKSLLGLGKNVLRGLGNVADSVLPMGTVTGLANLATAPTDADRKTAETQLAGALTGFTISHGVRGGPALGDVYQTQDEVQMRVSDGMPQIVDMVKRGQTTQAMAKLRSWGVSPGLAAYYIRVARNPALRLTGRKLRDFNFAASPEEKAQLASDRAAADDQGGAP